MVLWRLQAGRDRPLQRPAGPCENWLPYMLLYSSSGWQPISSTGHSSVSQLGRGCASQLYQIPVFKLHRQCLCPGI
jgi:hypothetical protein